MAYMCMGYYKPSPNFFIIGGPKCGTTALSEYLRQHPNVCLSAPKEPMYFATDIPYLRLVKNEEDYLRCYAHCSSKQDLIAIGEGSALYLLSNQAISGILQFNPAAKFIIMVRNPMHMAVSMHSQTLFYGDEDVQSFENAWAMQDLRAKGEKIPARCRDPILLQYAHICMLGKQLERALSLIPRGQCHVVVFDDMVSKPRQAYLQVLEFLGLPDDGREHFPKVNERKAVKWPWMMDVLARPPEWLMNASLRLKHFLGVKTLGINRAIVTINSSTPRPIPIGHETNEAMLQKFSDDIDLLGRLLRRDLNEWKAIDK